MATGAQTGSEYIKHHLTNLTFGKDPTDGVWKFAHTAQEAQDMGFYAIHVDSMGWAIGLGISKTARTGSVSSRPILFNDGFNRRGSYDWSWFRYVHVICSVKNN